MKTRQTPRVIPNKHNYFEIDLDTFGVHNFRAPFPIYTARLMNLMVRAGLHEAITEDSDPDVIYDRTISVWNIAGAAIGMCWFHKNKDLETPRLGKNQDLLSYGEAVLDEMYDEGYDMDILQTLYTELFRVLGDSVVGKDKEKKVEERVDFSSKEKEDSTS